jgi:hypothetical protein
MKANGFKPFDDVADSMANAAARIGVPIEVIREAKRNGSSAFRGSRINLTQLREELASAQKEPPSISDVLLNITKEVADVVAGKLVEHHDRPFRDDSIKITQQIQLGLGLVACILEPHSADHFLKRSASVMEAIWTRKKAAASRSKRRGIAAKNHRNN